MRRLGALTLVLATACTAAAVDTTDSTPTTTPPSTAPVTTIPATSTTEPATEDPPATVPPAPVVPEGPLDATSAEGLDALIANIFSSEFDESNLVKIVEGGDPRVAWVIADLLRFYQGGPVRDELV